MDIFESRFGVSASENGDQPISFITDLLGIAPDFHHEREKLRDESEELAVTVESYG